MAEVLERALYRHFKSTRKEPKLYVTLKREVTDDGSVYIWYMPMYEFGTVVAPREEQEFLEIVHRKGKKIGRFILVLQAVITPEEADDILNNYYAEDN
jgi:hypothetical protein